MTNCLLFSGIKNRQQAPGMPLTLWQIWLAVRLITPAPACFPDSSGEADGETASPTVPGGSRAHRGGKANLGPRTSIDQGPPLIAIRDTGPWGAACPAWGALAHKEDGGWQSWSGPFRSRWAPLWRWEGFYSGLPRTGTSVGTRTQITALHWGEAGFGFPPLVLGSLCSAAALAAVQGSQRHMIKSG